MQMISRYVRNTRGQAVVELALVLPFLLLLVVGMMEFGLALHDYITVAEASRAGARAAAVGKDNETIISTVKAAAPTLDPEKIKVTIEPSAKAIRTVGSSAKVTVVYPVAIPVPYIINPFSDGGVFDILPASLDVTGKAVMRVESTGS